ncbi:hypothetical protein ACFS6H_20165 [Terrimonas rubra]|uniref:DUF3945 domain-containing protein n=1 Tax=Terrimonas rubra TaxID=1035890 RepID=A0ABW6AB79_9BACT
MTPIFGAQFQQGDFPTLRDVYIQNIQNDRLDKKLEQQQALQQDKVDAKAQAYITGKLDVSKYATGTPHDRMVSERIKELLGKYSAMQRQAGFDASEMHQLMSEDIGELDNYYRSSKGFADYTKKAAAEMAKKGFSPNEISNLLKERVLFNRDDKGNLSPKPLNEIDFTTDGLLEGLISEDYNRLSSVNPYKALQPLTYGRPTQTQNVKYRSSYTPLNGTARTIDRNGSVTFDPMFDVVTTDTNGIPTISKRKRPVLLENGKPYTDVAFGTNKPVSVLDDDIFDFMYNEGNPALMVTINKQADGLIKKLGRPVTQEEAEIIKKQVATDILEKNSKSKFTRDINDTVRQVHHHEPESQMPTTGISLDAIQPDANGDRDITNQVGGSISIGHGQKDDLFITKDGGLKVKTYKRNSYGEEELSGVKTLYGNDIKNYIKANDRANGVTNKDLKRLNSFQFADSFKVSPEVNTFNNLINKGETPGLQAPKKNTPQPAKQKSTPATNQKKKISW